MDKAKDKGQRAKVWLRPTAASAPFTSARMRRGFTPLEVCDSLLGFAQKYVSHRKTGAEERPAAFSRHFSRGRLLTGFTLLEMVVSFGIFAVVIVTAIGAVLAINNAQIKASHIQNIQDNLRFALESMTKEMRTGTNFQPSGGSPPAYGAITFTRSDGSQVGYCLQADTLKKISGASTDCSLGSAVTSDNLVVEQLIFYVIGQAAGPSDGQPRLTASIRARSRDPKLATAFRLQTTVVQRIRDR